MELPSEGPIASYRDLALFLGTALPAAIVATIAAHFLVQASPLRNQSKALQMVVPQVAAYIAAICVLAVFSRMQGKKLKDALRWTIRPGAPVISVAAGLVVSLAAILLAWLLRTPQVDSPLQQLITDDPVTVAVAAVTMAPVCEEIFFRGVLQPLLVRSAGIFGIVLTALPFALLHGPEYAWSWQHLVLLTLVGTSFGAVRHELQSTAASALSHGVYNAFNVILYLFGRAFI